MRGIDKGLGRLFLRCCAVVSFLAAAAATVFGAVVLLDGHLVGFVVLSVAALLVWLGWLAWRDRATMGELLNRDFERTGKGNPEP